MVDLGIRGAVVLMAIISVLSITWIVAVIADVRRHREPDGALIAMILLPPVIAIIAVLGVGLPVASAHGWAGARTWGVSGTVAEAHAVGDGAVVKLDDFDRPVLTSSPA